MVVQCLGRGIAVMTEAKFAIPYEDDAEREQLIESASAEGLEAREPENPGIAPFLVIVIAGGAFAVAGYVAKWLTERDTKGKASYGQIIDLRDGVDPDDVVRTDKDAKFEQIIIVTPNADDKTSTVKIETYDPENDFEQLANLIFSKLSEAVASTAEAVKDVAEAVTGDKGKVTVEEGARP